MFIIYRDELGPVKIEIEPCVNFLDGIAYVTSIADGELKIPVSDIDYIGEDC